MKIYIFLTCIFSTISMFGMDTNLNHYLAYELNKGKMDFDGILDLLENGADVNMKSSDKKYRTALGYVTSSGSVEQLERLLSIKNLDINIKNKNGHTAAHKACWSGNNAEEKLKLLCKKGININEIGEEGTALHATTAYLRCSKECREQEQREKKVILLMTLLMNYQANPNIPDKGGNTVLDIVETLGCEKVATMLKSHGATHSALFLNGSKLLE